MELLFSVESAFLSCSVRSATENYETSSVNTALLSASTHGFVFIISYYDNNSINIVLSSH